ncbi:MAG: PH domain-containing protein [Candidatus Saccharimonadales bacterium]|nr:PH domain-containing protein [Candidatus Saccharimonadales bacterium]
MSRKAILEIDPTEVVLHEVKRHPMGMLGILLVTGAVFIVYLGLLYFFIRNSADYGLQDAENAIIIGAILLGGLIVLGGYAAIFVYRQNELIVTNENIILINQVSLFSRKVSQLNLAKIQDVSGDQDTITENLFGFGTLTIETAGEMKNFIFTYCPNPAIHAKHIIEAHEQFITATANQTTPAHTPQRSL